MKSELNIENLKQINNQKAITFEEVVKRTKNKMLEEYTNNDLFDRYIAYRNRGRIK